MYINQWLCLFSCFFMYCIFNLGCFFTCWSVKQPFYLRLNENKTKRSIAPIFHICLPLYRSTTYQKKSYSNSMFNLNETSYLNSLKESPRPAWWRHQMETFWPVNSPHKGQGRGALMFSLICAWINDWANNHEADDLRRYHAHYDVIVMLQNGPKPNT